MGDRFGFQLDIKVRDITKHFQLWEAMFGRLRAVKSGESGDFFNCSGEGGINIIGGWWGDSALDLVG